MAYGDVLLVSLPMSDGREQSRRRPAVAIQADLANEPMLMVAPVTSDVNALRFTFTVRVEPSIELLLQSLKAEIAQSEVVQPACKPFRVQTFDLGADVIVDREAMYYELIQPSAQSRR